VALPPSPARDGGPGNKKLNYGLGGAAGVLGIALVAAALYSRGGGSDSDSPPVALQPVPEQPASNAPASGSASEPTTVEPDPTPPTPPAEERATPKPSTTKPASSTSHSTATKSPTPATSPTTPAKPSGTTPQVPPQVPAGTPAPPPVTPPPVTPPPASDRCAACQKAAQSGDIAAAAQAYAQCSNPGAKNACQSRAGQKAGETAVYAANNGKCSEARGILLAAQQMGVAAGRLAKAQAAVAACK
jgi:hypothetical protein